MSQAFIPENPVGKAASLAENLSNKFQNLSYGTTALKGAQSAYIAFGKNVNVTAKSMGEFVTQGNKLKKLKLS